MQRLAPSALWTVPPRSTFPPAWLSPKGTVWQLHPLCPFSADVLSLLQSQDKVTACKVKSSLQTDLVHKVSFPPLILITHLWHDLPLSIPWKCTSRWHELVFFYYSIWNKWCSAVYGQLYRRKSFGYATSYSATKLYGFNFDFSFFINRGISIILQAWMPGRQGNENKCLMLLNGHSNCTLCLQLNIATTKAFFQLSLLIVVAGQVCI